MKEIQYLFINKLYLLLGAETDCLEDGFLHQQKQFEKVHMKI